MLLLLQLRLPRLFCLNALLGLLLPYLFGASGIVLRLLLGCQASGAGCGELDMHHGLAGLSELNILLEAIHAIQCGCG